MDRIEHAVRLPDGAAALSSYARYYMHRDGKVSALYRIPDFPGPRRDDELKADNRRWVKDYNDFPIVLDGGCNIVDITFDETANRFERIECNGPS